MAPVAAFFAELRRRKVIRVTVAYLVVAWLLVQVAVTLEPPLGLPGWFDTLVIALAAIGLPVVVVLAWAFDITPDGIKRTPAAGVGPAEPAAAVARDPRSLAALPLNNMTGDASLDAGVDGLSEDLITALAQSPLQLHVTARNTVFRLKGQSVDVRETGAALGVRFVVEGGVQKDGEAFKLTLQLIDAVSGAHLWAGAGTAPALKDLRAMIVRTAQDFRKLLVDELQGALAGAINASALAARPADPAAFGAFIESLPDEHLYMWAFTTRFGADGDVKQRQEESLRIAERAAARRPQEARCLAFLAFLLMDNLLAYSAPDVAAVKARIADLCRRAMGLSRTDPHVAGFCTTSLFCIGEWRSTYTIVRTAASAPPYFRDLLQAAFENDYDGALERTKARIAGETAPGDQDRAVLAILHLARGEYDLAIRWFEEATMLYPDIFIAEVGRIGALELSGRHDEARAASVRLKQRWPNGEFLMDLDVDPVAEGIDPASPIGRLIGGVLRDAVTRAGLIAPRGAAVGTHSASSA